MASDIVGMALMALMVMLVIGGGITRVYLAGKRGSQGSSASGRYHRHARRRELFLGP